MEGSTCMECWVGILQLAAGALVCNMCGSQSQRIIDTQTEMDDIYSEGLGKITAKRISQRKKKIDKQLDFSSKVDLDGLTRCFIQCNLKLTQVVCEVLVEKLGFDKRLFEVVRQLFLSYIAKTDMLKPGFTKKCYLALGGGHSVVFDDQQQQHQQQQQQQQEEARKKAEEEQQEGFSEFWEEMQDDLEQQTQEEAPQQEEEVHLTAVQLRFQRKIEIRANWKAHWKQEYRKAKIVRLVLQRLLPGYACICFAFAGLQLLREAVMVHDLIRWVYRGVIPMAKTYDHIGSMAQSLGLGDAGNHILRKMMVMQSRTRNKLGWDYSDLIPDDMEVFSLQIFAYCEIRPPPPNWPLLLKRIFDELQIPKPVYSVAYNIIHTACLQVIHNYSFTVYEKIQKYFSNNKKQGLGHDWGGTKILVKWRMLSARPLIWIAVSVVHALQITYNIGGEGVNRNSDVFQRKLENAPEEPNWQRWAADKLKRMELPMEHLNWFRELMDLPSEQFHELLKTRIRSFFEPNTDQGINQSKTVKACQQYQQEFREFAEAHKNAGKFNDEMRDFFIQQYIQDLENYEEQSEEGVKEEKQKVKVRKAKLKSWRGLRAGVMLGGQPGFFTPDLMSIICTLSGYIWTKPNYVINIYFKLAEKIGVLHRNMPNIKLQQQFFEDNGEPEDQEEVDEDEQIEAGEQSEQSQQQEEYMETEWETDHPRDDWEQEQEQEENFSQQQQQSSEQQQQQQQQQQAQQQSNGTQSGSGLVQDTSMLQIAGEEVMDDEEFDYGF